MHAKNIGMDAPPARTLRGNRCRLVKLTQSGELSRAAWMQQLLQQEPCKSDIVRFGKHFLPQARTVGIAAALPAVLPHQATQVYHVAWIQSAPALTKLMLMQHQCLPAPQDHKHCLDHVSLIFKAAGLHPRAGHPQSQQIQQPLSHVVDSRVLAKVQEFSPPSTLAWITLQGTRNECNLQVPCQSLNWLQIHTARNCSYIFASARQRCFKLTKGR
mmetsp:Transcript_13629/g.32339  ORF Transcript_13629/g.32339 Transcript_13629/m.32339 type:complete len:215 (+) Transcript_13629:144-788(+)